MRSKRESLDAETIHSFIHTPAPAHTLFYTRAIAAGGANPRGGIAAGFSRSTFDSQGDLELEPQPKRIDR
jgi:hypothetical protein